MRANIRNIEHIRICGGRTTVCHWPLQGGLWYWGDDEILLAHIHAPCQYRDAQEVAHGQHGMFSRAIVRLQRSHDLGQTWPEAESQALYDYTLPIEEQRRLLRLDEYTVEAGPQREAVDMRQPDAIMGFGRAFVGKERSDAGGKPSGERGKAGRHSPLLAGTDENRKAGYNDQVVFGYRSPDRGRTWEKTPSIVWPNHTEWLTEVGNGYLRQADGTLLGWFVASGPNEGLGATGDIAHPQVYMSVDQGISWHYVSDIWRDPYQRIACSYPQIRRLPSGRLFCSLGLWMARNSKNRWVAVCHSDDGGWTWSEPKRIMRWGVSPYPIVLRDGRIVMVYALRYTGPYGMACVVSEDEGQTWSDEVILRDGAGHNRLWADIGYPVGTQLSNGQVFTAYYFQHEDADVPWAGGCKFIAGTFFALD